MSSDKTGESQSVLSNLKNAPQFFSESVDELKKVTSPTKQETIQATMATILIILFFSICLLILDFICHWLMGLLT